MKRSRTHSVVMITSIAHSTIRLETMRLGSHYLPGSEFDSCNRSGVKVVNAVEHLSDASGSIAVERELGWVCKGHKYPARIKVVHLKTNFGQEFLLASEDVPVRVRNERYDNSFFAERQNIDVQVRVRRYGPPRIQRNAYTSQQDTPWGTPVRYEDVQNAKVGDVIYQVKECAFYRTALGVTNDDFFFPNERPAGSVEWARHKRIGFASGISALNWSILLDVLVGKYFDEVIRFEVITCEVTERAVQAKRLRRIAHVQGQCFSGKIFDQIIDVEVSVGNRLLFIGSYQGRKVYVVDSPSYGQALYVFSDEQHARDYASNRMTAAEAQSVAHARIVHIDDWQERAKEAIATVS